MRIVKAYPPNYKQIVAALGQKSITTIYCYGDTIYSPSGVGLSQALIAHEQVHSDQQARYTGGVSQWWTDYLAHPAFRLAQEIPAHKAEYYELLKIGNRHERRAALKQLATRLSGPLYGSLISRQEAENELRVGTLFPAIPEAWLGELKEVRLLATQPLT